MGVRETDVGKTNAATIAAPIIDIAECATITENKSVGENR
jgi:hypothetical protein